MKRKTFLFVTDTEYEKGNLTGAHKRFLELAKSVSKDYDVFLVSKRIPELEKYNIKKIIIKKSKMTFLPAHLSKIITISRILRSNKKKIHYDYAVSFGPVDTICYKLSGYNRIVTLFREDFIGYKKVLGMSGMKLLYFKTLEKLAVKNSQKIIVQCNDDRDALVNRYSKKIVDIKSKIHVQINNVNASWISGGESPKTIVGDAVTIVFIGNFSDKRKGHHLLLPAIQRLIDDGYKVKLYVIGDGKLLSECREKYKKYKEIIFLGRITNVGEVIAKSDFEIAPSLIDSCPNTVLEGIGAGIAVYGTNIGGIWMMTLYQKKNH